MYFKAAVKLLTVGLLIVLFHVKAGANPLYVHQYPADGDQVAVNFILDSVENGQPIISFQGNFSFDPAAAIPDTVFTGNVISGGGIFSYSVDSVVGKCYFAYAGLNHVAGSGQIMGILFTVFDFNLLSQSEFILQINDMQLNEGYPEINIYYNQYLDVDDSKYIIPGQFSLEQNYPNPFNPSTTIEYTLERHGFVELEIYDIKGRRIVTLVDEHQNTGDYKIKWDGYNRFSEKAASGIYLYTIRVNGFSVTRKMIMIK